MKKVFGKRDALKKKRRLSVRMPHSMIMDIENSLKSEGHSIKFRSKWISAAINELSQDNNHLDLISEEWIEPGNNEIIQITLEQKAEQKLNDMDKNLNKIISTKDINSSIVRTAILQKLIKKGCPESGHLK